MHPGPRDDYRIGNRHYVCSQQDQTDRHQTNEAHRQAALDGMLDEAPSRPDHKEGRDDWDQVERRQFLPQGQGRNQIQLERDCHDEKRQDAVPEDPDPERPEIDQHRRAEDDERDHPPHDVTVAILGGEEAKVPRAEAENDEDRPA